MERALQQLQNLRSREKREEVGIIKTQKLGAGTLGAETQTSEEGMLPPEGRGKAQRNSTLDSETDTETVAPQRRNITGLIEELQEDSPQEGQISFLQAFSLQ